MTDTFKLTLDLNKNIFIEACAGAGKTYVLAKRYARIMDAFAETGQFDARNILVITFTKKAAAEMSGRIYQDLNFLLNDEPIPGLPEDFGQNLRQASPAYKLQVRATFGQNAISTIDSFCAGILRDHAQLAGLDPEFVPQDEADTDRLYLETWRDFLQRTSRQHDQNLAGLLEFFSRSRIENAVKTIHSNRQLLDDWLTDAAESADNLKSRLTDYFPAPINISYWSEALVNLLALLPDPAEMLNPDEKNYQMYAKSRDGLSQLNLENPALEDIASLMEILWNITISPSSKDWRKQIAMPLQSWPKGPVRDQFNQAVKDFIAEFSSQYDPEIFIQYATLEDILACEAQHLLARFYHEFEKELTKAFDAKKVLSFDEIITHTHGLLLDHPEIAAGYGRQFRHIMVDEFQDTNELRWDIIRRIASSDNGQLRSTGLFVVGDTKQSIYRFNQADVTVMHQVKRLITDSGNQPIHLNETYRSSQAFVDRVINPLMSEHFTPSASAEPIPDFDTRFDATRMAAASPLQKEPLKAQLSRCIVAAVTRDRTVDPLELGGSPDVIQTAQLAREMLAWARENQLNEPGKPVVGILLRAFTRVGEYIRVFNRMNIPLQVVAGKGLFKQQEAFDLFHWVRVMINPLDDLALVGLLRSPFFALPDREIHALRPVSGGTFRAQLITHQPAVHDAISTWRKMLQTEPLDRVLEAILTGQDRLLGWTSETAGSQRVGNLERLIHLLHQQSMQGQTLHDIYHYLNFQINQDGDAPQADLPSPADIQIMTIHKAKGLEFPVVLLPELHRKGNSDNSGIAVERWPAGKRKGEWLLGVTLDSLTDGSRKTNLQQFLNTQRKREEEAEDRRLFYVAVTRAKYGLGCLAAIDPENFYTDKTWWGKYIAPHFELPHKIDKEEKCELLPEPAIWAAQALKFAATEIRLETPDALSLPQLESVDWNPPVHINNAQQFAEISPHDIMDWVNPGSGSFIPEVMTDADEDGNPYALTFGRVLHRIMEMGWWDVRKYGNDIKTYLETEGVFEGQAAYFTDLHEILARFHASAFFREYSALAKNQKFPELPILGWLENATHRYRVTGIMDLLYHREDGQWVVLDYKTDQEIPEFSDKSPHRHPYWFQIQTYLWMVRQSFGIEAVGELLFMRTGEKIGIKPDFEQYAELIAEKKGGAALGIALLKPEVMTTDLSKSIAQFASEGPYFLLEPTRGLAMRAYQTLAAAGKLRPGCMIQSQREFFKNRAFPVGRHLNADVVSMAVADILKKDDLGWGVHQQLADAVLQHLKFGTLLLAPFTDLPGEVLRWCKAHQVISDQDILPVNEWDLPAESVPIMVDGMFSTNPLDYQLVEQLRQHFPKLIFLQKTDLDNVSNGWRWAERVQPELHRLPPATPPPPVFVCFSAENEVDQAAQQILHLLRQNIQPIDIKIAVSSMERYVPVIKRTFQDYGIPVTIAKHEPVAERPATQLVLSLLDAHLSFRLSWQQVTAVWLHPLLDHVTEIRWNGLTSDLSTLNDRLKLDRFVRQQGWRGLAELRVFVAAVAEKPDTLDKKLHARWDVVEQSAINLLKFYDTILKGSRDDSMQKAADWLEQLMTSLRLENTLSKDEVARRTLFAIKNTLRKIESTWTTYAHRPGTAAELYRELSEKLGKEEIKSGPQPFGVEILGNQESVNLAPKHLIVLGLSEGQFPVKPHKNPFLDHLPFNPWYFNLAIFMRWLNLGEERVTFYAPEMTVGGESLQPSTFTEYLNVRRDNPWSSQQSRSYRHYLETLSNRLLNNPGNHQLARHNAYLTAAHHEFAGDVGPDSETEFAMSASRLDNLLKCPQRYWYASPLNLSPLDDDSENALNRRIGNFIHKVLERFGDATVDQVDGFDLLSHDYQQSVAYLADVVDRIRAEYHFDGELDLLTQGKLFPYLNNLRESPEGTLLGKLLEWNVPLTGKFDQRYYEQPFGMPDKENSWPAVEISSLGDPLVLKLRGYIDRIFANDQYVWAVDYKTGRVSIKDTRDFFASQLFVYFLALQQRFPLRDNILSYEKLKSLKKDDFGISELAGMLTETHPVNLNRKSRKNDIPIGDPGDVATAVLTVETITQQLLAFAQPLKTGSFALTVREEKRACKFCEFEQICRKTTVFHRAENDDSEKDEGDADEATES
ncbi:MAG: hypothetical protein AUJ47_01415 [Candidatus Marinimicrobia bacterium CG1_02_48_14]|nr:MAG: hypothetical protein AUJ47_01415 [Candidatus Marinimicrobia bacterium CG1_02_48_14]